MGCEDVACSYDLTGFGEGESFLHKLSYAFEDKECRMPLVYMPDGGCKVHFVKGFEASYSQNNLLLDPHFAVSAVELPGYVPVTFLIIRKICIQKVQDGSANLHLPDRCRYDSRSHWNLY